MSDYFFYDMNKKMADLANRQQLAEDAQAAPVKPASSALRSQLNERDLGKHNNATTGFAALAKKTGGGEKGARIAGAQLAKMRAKGQVEESGKPDFLDLDKDGNRKEPMKSAARSAKKGMDEGAWQPVDEPVAKPMAKASAPKPNPNVPGSMIKVGPDTGPVKKTQPPKVPGYNDSVPVPDPYAIVKKPANEGGVPMTPKQKKFAALAKPFNKISFADKIVGAKKEVDEMLGDVAANAMKNAVGKMRGRNRDMEESFLDDEPTSRRSSTGGRIDTSEPGVTRHRAVKGNYSGAAHDAGADDEPSGQLGRRKVGAGMGKKIGAKINRGTSKLMTKEGDMPEDMIEPEDQGEYDQEGQMAKDDIKTVVRHAQALEKILGDNDNLPEWVQAKLAKIEGMMTAVDDYMQNQQDDEMEVDEESTNKRDSRAERAGRKVAKDIEYDEKKKDGIHGKKRGSEDDKAEKAGKRVTKDIEYDEKKKDKKKKEVDETTTSGSVATGAAPKSSAGTTFGKGIYDSLNRQLENMISESMNINMSMNNDEHGGPRKSLTVTATDDDAVMLAGLLKMAGMGHGDEHIHAMTGNDSDMQAIHDMDHEEPCSSCGSSPCGCDDEMMDEDRWGAEQPPKLPNDMSVTGDGGIDVKKSGSDWVYKSKEPGGRVTVTIPAKASNKMLPNTTVDEAYGDTDASDNEPDWPTDQEYTDMDQSTDPVGNDLHKNKSTGQTTIPVIAGQKDRMGYNGLDEELSRMLKIAGISGH